MKNSFRTNPNLWILVAGLLAVGVVAYHDYYISKRDKKAAN